MFTSIVHFWGSIGSSCKSAAQHRLAADLVRVCLPIKSGAPRQSLLCAQMSCVRSVPYAPRPLGDRNATERQRAPHRGVTGHRVLAFRPCLVIPVVDGAPLSFTHSVPLAGMVASPHSPARPVPPIHRFGHPTPTQPSTTQWPQPCRPSPHTRRAATRRRANRPHVTAFVHVATLAVHSLHSRRTASTPLGGRARGRSRAGKRSTAGLGLRPLGGCDAASLRSRKQPCPITIRPR